MSRSLDRALQRFRTPPADGDPDGSVGRVDVAGRVSTAAFRAAIEERMRNVERDIAQGASPTAALGVRLRSAADVAANGLEIAGASSTPTSTPRKRKP